MREPDFRRLWSAQFVSNIGSWMQTVAAQWVMLSLTTSALLVSAISAAASIPVLRLSSTQPVPAGSRAMATTEAAAVPGLALPPLTAEDAARSWDRSRVHHARGHSKRWRLLWLLVGPGILATLGENDGRA